MERITSYDELAIKKARLKRLLRRRCHAKLDVQLDSIDPEIKLLRAQIADAGVSIPQARHVARLREIVDGNKKEETDGSSTPTDATT